VSDQQTARGRTQESASVPPVIVVAGDDLLFSQRIASALEPLGYRPVIARTAEAFHASLTGPPPAAAVLNLASHRFDALAAIRAAKSGAATRGVPLLGFCGHTDVARHRAAQAAGCDLVATNGEVAGHLGRLLTQLLSASQAPPASGR
jgi:PleD family two-component response regulator